MSEFKKGVRLGAGVIIGVMAVQLVIGTVAYGLLKLAGQMDE